jgi:hypothetical protein
MQATIQPRVVLAPNESVALANLLVSPKEITVSGVTYQDVAKAKAYKYSVKALREEHEDVTIKDLSAAHVTRHLQLDFFFLPVFHSTFRGLQVGCNTYADSGVSGIRVGCFCCNF